MRILVLVLLSCCSMQAMSVSELFCAGLEKHDQQDAGERNYLLVMDDDRTQYEVYEGMKERAIFSGKLSSDRLFFHDLTMGDYQTIVRRFQLSRVTLKYELEYTLRSGVNIQSSGQCERYQVQI